MRKITVILLACTLILGASSCKRRPLNNADYNVNVVLNIDKEIVNYRYPGDPEAMRVAFFNHKTGRLVTHAFLPATGGQVSVLPGESYDVIAYNFDTQVTLIKDENDFNKILATTNCQLAYYQDTHAVRHLKDSSDPRDIELYQDFCDFVAKRPYRNK